MKVILPNLLITIAAFRTCNAFTTSRVPSLFDVQFRSVSSTRTSFILSSQDGAEFPDEIDPDISRRSMLLNTIAAASASVMLPQVSLAATNVPINAAWSAVDGLNTNDNKFVAFDSSAYQAMVRDPARTPFFEKSIIQRINSAGIPPEEQIVLDLGTGPYAVFAIIAAENGAGTVYAIEANPEAARAARVEVIKKGFEDVITVIDGFSNQITLPNDVKADFCIAEIIGSIATEEGVYPTILDAHKRLVKNPTDPRNWIPNRVQTIAAPASYTLHNLFKPPAFDWNKIRSEPVRFNCKDQGLQLLSNPQIAEDINFAEIDKVKPQFQTKLQFTIDPDRIEDNAPALLQEFRQGKVPQAEAQTLAKATASSFTGVALWPRLLLPSASTSKPIEINSRSYPDGNHQRSHWQTVLPIMNETPVPIQGGDEVMVTFDVDIPEGFKKAPSYSIAGNVANK